jgi:ATP phosphoribosyltransferase
MSFAGDRSKKILMYAMMQQQAAAVAAKTPPEDIRPTITPDEEQKILAAMLPIPEPEPSFVKRNAIPLFVGGGVLTLGILGIILMVKI